MLNVNQITSQLAKMPDQELQKYAAMHKTDPYILSLAISESNRRKELRNQAQGMHAGQAQPKVVDQEVAQMAQPMPEEVGIGALPAQNMQGMAGGGIVAFDEGGAVPRFQNQGVVQYPYGMSGAAASDMYSIPGLTTGQPFSQQEGQPELTWVQRKRQETIDKMNKGIPVTPQERMMVSMFGSGAPRADKAGNTTPTTASQAPTYDAATQEKGTQLLEGMRDKTVTVPAADNVGGNKDTTGNTQAPGAQPASLGGLGGLSAQFQDFLKNNKPAGPEDMDAYMKRRSDYLGENPTEKQMQRLDKQEARALADREEAKSMALLKAGLAMMSGTSKNALENIGKGAMAGLEDFAISQKDAKKLALERDKMRDSVENAAFAYKKGDLDAYEKYTQDAKKAQNDFAMHGLSALGTMAAHDISGQYSLAGQREHAAATKANGPLAVYNALGGGDLAKGFERAKQIEAGTKKDLMTEYTAWLAGNTTAQTMEPDKAAALFLKTKGVFDAASANAMNMKPTNKPVGKVFE